MRACHSRSAEAISSMIGCEEPDTVSSPDVRVGRGGKGLLNWDSVRPVKSKRTGQSSFSDFLNSEQFASNADFNFEFSGRFAFFNFFFFKETKQHKIVPEG